MVQSWAEGAPADGANGKTAVVGEDTSADSCLFDNLLLVSTSDEAHYLTEELNSQNIQSIFWL